MLTKRTLGKKVATLKELKAEREALDKKIAEIENVLKSEMTERNEYELVGKNWKVTWTKVTSSRFDQRSFKEAYPNLFESYKTVSESRRFLLT